MYAAKIKDCQDKLSALDKVEMMLSYFDWGKDSSVLDAVEHQKRLLKDEIGDAQIRLANQIR